MSDIRLIVGLGNPGIKYELTRHNIGFMIVDFLSTCWGVKWKLWKEFAEISQVEEKKGIYLFKPKTFMNCSGVPVKEVINYLSLKPEEMLVIYDDFSLPLGKIRCRTSGSSGGHNGVLSIIKALGSTDFPRMKLGIGPILPYIDKAEFVLSKFTKQEQEIVSRMIESASKIVDLIIEKGWHYALSKYLSFIEDV